MQFEKRFKQQLADLAKCVQPTSVAGGKLLYFNDNLAEELDIDLDKFEPYAHTVWWGASLLPGMTPIAQVYSGHQFGVWAGQLGDGRGLLLGEQRLSNGQCVDWHLKGAGKTPFSRSGDGRAVIRSSVREFLASEAMHALGIPSSRALSIAISDEPVYREQTERAAMLMRVAPSHLRFGHIEHSFYHQQPAQIHRLVDFAIEQYWPELLGNEDKYLHWFGSVVQRTARLIADWQAVGFIHGVMNTDNMSLLGITLDYGPYQFMDSYQPEHSGNYSDYQGRYRFENQPTIALWNLNCLAYALTSLLSAKQIKHCLAQYEVTLMQGWGSKMRTKLGLTTAMPKDGDLLIQLFKLMALVKADYTRTFRLLGQTEKMSALSPLQNEFNDSASFDTWFAVYRQRLRDEESDDAQRHEQMNQINPALILRNYMAQEAIIAAEQGDNSVIAELHRCLQAPFDQQHEHRRWFCRPPEGSLTLHISCSS